MRERKWAGYVLIGAIVLLFVWLVSVSLVRDKQLPSPVVDSAPPQ